MQKQSSAVALFVFQLKKRKSATLVYPLQKPRQKAADCGKLVAIFHKSRKILDFFAFFDKKFSTLSTNAIVENKKIKLPSNCKNIGI